MGKYKPIIWDITIKYNVSKIAKLVQITPRTMVYGTYNELVTGAYKPTYNWGHHLVWDTLTNNSMGINMINWTMNMR